MNKIFFTLCALLFFSCDVYAIQSVGRFLADDVDCKVIHQGKSQSCNRKIELYPDDVVVTAADAKNIKVQWLVPQRTKLDPLGQGRYRIAYDSNAGKSGSFMGSITDYFKKSAHEGQYMVARDVAVKISPPQGSTLLIHRAVEFSWCEKGPVTFSILNEEGRDIFHRQVNDLSNLKLLPSEIGLKPGGAYTWLVEGKNRFESQFTILDSKENVEVEEAFRSAPETGDELDHVLQQASFVIFLSDERPNSFNFKWLASQLVTEWNNELYMRDKKMIRYLEQRIDIPKCAF